MGAWVCSVVVVAAWGSILLMGVTDPLGGINTLPAVRHRQPTTCSHRADRGHRGGDQAGLVKWAWIPGVPLLWDLTVTLTASWQKIFSGDPKLGYWTQHSQYLDAQHAGKTAFGAAKNAHQLSAVIRNTFIQGTLSIVFAVVVVIVVVVGVIVSVRAIRGGAQPRVEQDPVPSKIFGPRNYSPPGRKRGAEAVGRVGRLGRQTGGTSVH